jgi:ADP-heptose:LPS heptosyltransferase
MSPQPKHILIARTDSIGDVILTLPMCGWIKKHFPNCRISFIGRSYTRAVIESSVFVDDFINWDDAEKCSPNEQIALLRETGADTIIHVFPRKAIMWVAKRAGIPVRIATGRRLQTIMKCNKLVFFSRKKSDLHEAQLNMKLLQPLGIPTDVTLAEIPSLYGFEKIGAANSAMRELLSTGKKNVILHPLSKGSAVEWGLPNFSALIELCKNDQVHFFVSGTKADGEKIQSILPLQGENVTDITGMFSLAEFISFIAVSDALVAASTGPLHIAAASGIQAIGLYSAKRPIHPGRWMPLGKKAAVLYTLNHPQEGEKLDIAPSKVREVLLDK